MTASSSGSEPGSRVRLNVLLYVVAMLVAAGCVVVGVGVYQDRNEEPIALPKAGAASVQELDEGSRVEQDRTAAVLTSATSEATAFVNIRYDKAEESIAEVRDGATGAFREQYDKSTDGVTQVLTQNKSVMDGRVLWAGVVAADEDSATVVVATTGTVANTQSGDKPVARNFRLQLTLVLEGDRWLTNDLQFVA